MNTTTKKICITAMGAALFVVLSLCLQVPVFENYYLCLGYIVMGVFCYYFGPVSGITVGTLGVCLYCLLISGLRGLPGWVIGNVIIGLMMGLACKCTVNIKSKLFRQIIIMIAVVVSTAIGILGIKSIVECFLYAQPFLLRAAKNMTAFIADIVVLGISFPIALSIEPIMHKTFKELVIHKKGK